jgi:hypothetical protein
VRKGLECESKTRRPFNVQTSFHRGHICGFYCGVLSLSALSYIRQPGGRSVITTSIDDFPIGKWLTKCLFSGRGGIDLEYVEFYTDTKNRSEIDFGTLMHSVDHVTVLGTTILLQRAAH